jgi:hypothetical protein
MDGRSSRLGPDRRLVTFGLINGFLRRVHKYPLYSPPNPLLASAQPKNRLPKHIREYYSPFLPPSLHSPYSAAVRTV